MTEEVDITDEQFEQEIAEFEEAETALVKEAKKKNAEQIEEEKEETDEEKAKRYYQILTALGFKRYDDEDVTNFNIRTEGVKIGVKFYADTPAGKLWAYGMREGKKVFYKEADLAQLSLVQRYRAIKKGNEPIPETEVTGKLLEKRGKAILIQIVENGETKEIFYGAGAVKKDEKGHFIPAGFSKVTSSNPIPKMALPRDIRLPDYESEISEVPVTEPTGNGKPKQSLPPRQLEPGEKPTVDYYVALIGEITEKVRTEERIADREQGYAISKVFDAITKDRRAALIAELKNGGDHGE